MTRDGVLVEACPHCHGIWLDEGEIFHFARKPLILAAALHDAKAHALAGSRTSPAGDSALADIELFDGRVHLSISEANGGIWIDGVDVERLSAGSDFTPIELAPVPPPVKLNPVAGAAALPVLPNLFLHSVVTLAGLYALLTAALIGLSELGYVNLTTALWIGVVIITVQFIFSPWIMDLSLRWFYGVTWLERGRLPQHLEAFLDEACRREGLPRPRCGMIEDGAPNAFTYGRGPGDARLIITRGILEILEPDEVEAVAAHELGHIKHRDMFLMTVAQVVPLVMYYIFKLSTRRSSGGSNKKGGAYVAIVAYLLYIFSEYAVLWFSRTREFHADRFSGRVTGRPNALCSALVKIAYGLAAQSSGEDNATKRKPAFEAVGALGIFDPKAARSFTVASYAASPTTSGVSLAPDAVQGAMQWDVWNPWAAFYELNSTHPLVAKRMMALGAQATVMGQEPFITFRLKQPESYWDEFAVDALIGVLPTVLLLGSFALAGVTKSAWMIGAGLCIAGIASMVKLTFSHPQGHFPAMRISSLLKQVKVSGVRGVPCTLRGRIIGRGDPGLIWSEDFVLRDDSGIMLLDYRQPLRIMEFLFGLMRGGRYIGQEVVVTGWFRRAPVPYLQIDTLSSGEPVRSWVYIMRFATAVGMIVGGILLAMATWS